MLIYDEEVTDRIDIVEALAIVFLVVFRTLVTAGNISYESTYNCFQAGPLIRS